jgi:hypothetical protein
MGWALDGNTALDVGRGFLEYNSTLFLRVGGGGGLYRRVGAGVWNRVQLAVGPIWGRGTACEWNGLLWEVGTDDKVYWSNNGIAWNMDLDIGVTWGTTSPTYGLGADPDGTYLYLVHVDGVNFYFARRNVAGVWQNNFIPARAIFMGMNNTQGIIVYDSYVFHSSGSYGLERWDGAAWVEDSLTAVTLGAFPVHDGTIFTVAPEGVNDIAVWRWTGSDWEQEMIASSGGNQTSYLSIGADNVLYIGTSTADALIYERDDDSETWSLLDQTNVVAGGSTCATYFGSTWYFCERSAGGDGIYMHTRTFNIHPAPIGGGVAGNGLPPQMMDCDGDGDYLYLCVYDNAANNPMLIRVPLPLTATSVGFAFFDPGAGSAINVKCCTASHELAIAGNFGANDQVEVSEDAGMTWADIDPGTWGAETAQPLLVDPDTVDGVKVALQTARAIVETTDGGATWVTRNAAVGYGPDAMARLDVDSDELVVGDAHAARKVEYSPNRGVTLQDITGGAAIGNVVALEVA